MTLLQKIFLWFNLTAVAVLCFLYRSQKAEINSQKKELVTKQFIIDSVTHFKDSISDESFNNSITIGRYEITLDYLREVDPKAADKFEYFLYHETE